VKKIIAAGTAALFLLPCLAVAAFAGPNDGYPGVVDTAVKAKAPDKVKSGKEFTVRANLVIAANDNPCEGHFLIKLTNPNTGVEKTVEQDGTNKRDVFRAQFTLKAVAKWDGKAKWIPAYRNPCQGSHDEFSVKVVAKK
jgi:hypothetical protein